MAEQQALSTKDLKRVLGFGSLMSTAVGQIIGAGIMSLMGIAIAMTGRSAVLSFMIAAVIIIVQIIPLIIISGTVRMRGGEYTRALITGGKTWSGIVLFYYFFSNLSLAMYAMSFADYALRFVPSLPHKAIAIGVLTLFFVLNMFGIDKMAKVQNIIVVVMCISLGLLAAFGIGKVKPGFFEEGWMTNGLLGMLQAAALLTFATGGAQVIASLSAESKNPTRDIPLAIIISTVSVAVLYAFLAVVACGVLPVAQVAGKPLTLVAEEVLPAPVFIFFMVGGAMFALATTLNSQFASSPKPMLQASVDGWLPKQLAYIHPKYKTPMVWLAIFYLVGLVPIITGLNIGQVANLVRVLGQVIGVVANLLIIRLPKVLPAEWARSKYHVPTGALVIIGIVVAASNLITTYLLMSSMTLNLILINAGMVVVMIAYSAWRIRGGYLNNMEVSYEST
jgi:APA family basic amino acid/polyamine antiporter